MTIANQQWSPTPTSSSFNHHQCYSLPLEHHVTSSLVPLYVWKRKLIKLPPIIYFLLLKLLYNVLVHYANTIFVKSDFLILQEKGFCWRMEMHFDLNNQIYCLSSTMESYIRMLLIFFCWTYSTNHPSTTLINFYIILILYLCKKKLYSISS